MIGGGGRPTGTVQFQVDGNNVQDLHTVALHKISKALVNTPPVRPYPCCRKTHDRGRLFGGYHPRRQQRHIQPDGQKGRGPRNDDQFQCKSLVLWRFGHLHRHRSRPDKRWGGAGGTFPTGKVQFVVDDKNFGAPATLRFNEFSRFSGVATAAITTSNLSAKTHTIVADYLGDNNFTAGSGALAGRNRQQGLQHHSVNFQRHYLHLWPIGNFYSYRRRDSGRWNTGRHRAVRGRQHHQPRRAGDTFKRQRQCSPSSSWSETTPLQASGGNANYGASRGTLPGGQTVNKAEATIAVDSSKNPSNYNDSVTFSASVTGAGARPTGTVQFQVDGTDLWLAGNNHPEIPPKWSCA